MVQHNGMIGDGRDSPVPDFINPITGYRIFNIKRGVEDGPFILQSPYKGSLWEGLEQQAICIRDGSAVARPFHVSPSQRCMCGLYAYYDLMKTFGDHEEGICAYINVIAGVTVWGKIEVHAEGLRAQHLHVHVLGYPFEKPSMALEALRDRYQVPLVRWVNMPEIVNEYGFPIPEEVLPGFSPARAKYEVFTAWVKKGCPKP